MKNTNMLVRIAAFAAAGLLAASSAGAYPAAVNGSFSDDFASYPKNTCLGDGQTVGPWQSGFSGYGCNQFGTDANGSYIELKPQASASLSETHGGLMLGPSFSGSYTYNVTIKTVAQLRRNNPANDWEIGWTAWNYADNTHFYYFQPKATGWELGKEDPAYRGAQRFLATGSAPRFALGVPHQVKIVQNANTMTVYCDNQLVTTFTDNERPYSSGRIGVYSEDSQDRFYNVSVAPLGASPTPTPVVTNPAPTPVVTPPPSNVMPIAGKPSLTSLSPAVASAKAPAAFNLSVLGTGFVQGAQVYWNGQAVPTVYKSPTQLVASIPASGVAQAGGRHVTVSNPAPGAASNSLVFVVQS